MRQTKRRLAPARGQSGTEQQHITTTTISNAPTIARIERQCNTLAQMARRALAVADRFTPGSEQEWQALRMAHRAIDAAWAAIDRAEALALGSGVA